MYQSREELLTLEELKEAQDIVRTSKLRVRRTPCILVAKSSQERLDEEPRLPKEKMLSLRSVLAIPKPIFATLVQKSFGVGSYQTHSPG